jgi:hypothetical protein
MRPQKSYSRLRWRPNDSLYSYHTSFLSKKKGGKKAFLLLADSSKDPKILGELHPSGLKAKQTNITIGP